MKMGKKSLFCGELAQRTHLDARQAGNTSSNTHCFTYLISNLHIYSYWGLEKSTFRREVFIKCCVYFHSEMNSKHINSKLYKR